jgi:hypothetical protein
MTYIRSGLGLIISPGLNGTGSTRRGSQASVGLSRVTGNLDPILTTELVSRVVPLRLAGGVGRTVGYIAAGRETRGRCLVGVAISHRLCGTSAVNLGKPSVGNGRVGLGELGGLDGVIGNLGDELSLCFNGSKSVGMRRRRGLDLGV